MKFRIKQNACLKLLTRLNIFLKKYTRWLLRSNRKYKTTMIQTNWYFNTFFNPLFQPIIKNVIYNKEKLRHDFSIFFPRWHSIFIYTLRWHPARNTIVYIFECHLLECRRGLDLGAAPHMWLRSHCISIKQSNLSY